MIESNQRVGKYGFKFLALVENLNSLDNKKNKIQVQMFLDLIFFFNDLTNYFLDSLWKAQLRCHLILIRKIF